MLRRAILFIVLVACLMGCAAKADIQTTRVNGVDIGYRITGHGEPLLMIMGYAGTMDAWDPTLVDRLAEHYQVILFDNRNVGYSATSPDTLSIGLMARDGLALLDALHIESAHVIGWSMGSIIAQEMALNKPDSVRKLVLYGTTDSPEAVMQAIGKFDGLTPEQFMAMLFPAQWVTLHPDVYARLPRPAIPATPEAIKRQRSAMADWTGTADRLKTLGQDTLLVVGEEDTITPPDQSLAVAAEIPGAWLVRFKGGGHWLMYQTPDSMASAIHEFLGSEPNLLQ